MTITVLPRSSWANRAPRTTPKALTSFADGWFIHWLGATNPATASDVEILRATQRYHMDAKGWNDIAYSFAIGRQHPDCVYTLRGWGIQGGHTEGHNSTSMAVVFLLGPGEIPTPTMLDTCAQFLRGAGPAQYAAPPAKVRPHRAVRQTDCPGPDLTAWIAAGMPTITTPGTDMTPAQTDAVKAIQAALNSWGVNPPLTVDGDPGPLTVKAIKDVMAFTGVTLAEAEANLKAATAELNAAKALAARGVKLDQLLTDVGAALQRARS